MNTTKKYSEIIANYLYDDMSQEEREKFENDLLVNEELAKEYQIQSAANRYIESRIVLEEMQSDPHLAEAEEFVEDYFDTELTATKSVTGRTRTGSSWKKNLYWMGAVAAVFIGIITTVSVLFSEPSDTLFHKYYTAFDEATMSVRGNDSDLSNEISKGIGAYSSGDYEKSVQIFQQLSTGHPDNPVIKFYLGLNHMALKQYKTAIIQFEDYLNTYEVFIPEVKWYLGLCYLKSGDQENAILLLQDLEQYPGKFGEDAKTLKSKIQERLSK